MIKFKVSYTVFGNFGSHKILELPEEYKLYEYLKVKQIVKLIIWNIIKDEDWDWPIDIDQLEINKINEESILTK